MAWLHQTRQEQESLGLRRGRLRSCPRDYYRANVGASSASCVERSLDRLDLRAKAGDLRLLQLDPLLQGYDGGR